jgi:hypothetical protein
MKLWPFLVMRPFRFRASMLWMTSLRTVLDPELLSERGRLTLWSTITLINGPLMQRNIVGVAIGDHPDLSKARVLAFNKFAEVVTTWGANQTMTIVGGENP